MGIYFIWVLNMLFIAPSMFQCGRTSVFYELRPLWAVSEAVKLLHSTHQRSRTNRSSRLQQTRFEEFNIEPREMGKANTGSSIGLLNRSTAETIPFRRKKKVLFHCNNPHTSLLEMAKQI